MIQATSLTKDYGPTRAVNELTFTVERGQVVGFLGPNGAGKSTTIRMITGFSPPTSGQAQVNGHDVVTQKAAARASIGYLPESTPLYPEMRVTEYLDYRGRLLKMPRKLRVKRIETVIDQCNLQPMRRRTINRLSKGNRQRVGLAQALLHEPKVLILDEPTSGFDPNQIQQFQTLIQSLKGQHTILLSTHILPQIQETADRLLILAHGQLVADGKAVDLQKKADANGPLYAEVKTENDHNTIESTLPNWTITNVQKTQDGWTKLWIDNTNLHAAEQLSQAIQQAGWPIRELRRQSQGLESLFASMTTTTNNNNANTATIKTTPETDKNEIGPQNTQINSASTTGETP